MIQKLNDSTFKDAISQGYAVVDFWAEWCGPCKMMEPILENLSSEMNMVKFFKVNIDDFPKLATANDVMSIPYFVVYKDGRPIGSSIGAISKASLVAKLTSLMKPQS